MAYVPPNKRYSKDPKRSSPTPELLPPENRRKFNRQSLRNNNVDRSGRIVYDDNAIARWFAVGFDEDDQVPSSVNLEPVSAERFSPKPGEKSLVLVNSKPAKENGEGSENTSTSAWEIIAKNVWPDLLSSYEIVKNKMKSEDLEELKPTLVARIGKILFTGNPSWGLEGVRESEVSQLRRLFCTNIPSSYMENIVSEVVPKTGFSFIGEKEVFLVKFSYSSRPDSTISCKCTVKEDKTLELYKVELHQVRQMVVDVSCVNKDDDLRLMLITKKILTALTDEEMNSIRNLINLAVLDPDVKGGLRWAFGKSHSKNGFRVIGIWHTTTKQYKTPLLKLKVRQADRYDFKTATGDATMEVVLKLKKIASDLLEEKVEKDLIFDVFKDNLRFIWEHFL